MIRLEKIEKRFGERHVLEALSMEVPSGEFAILLGPSGAGKTVLLSILAGLERPTAGRVLLDGRDMADVPPELRPVTMVFQRHALFPHLTVFENIAFSLRARHQPHGMVRARVGELLELVGLQAYAHSKPDVLSGGQCQRAAFARALAADAEVVLFDEPLASLDKGMKSGLMAELKKLHRAARFTAIYVTHNFDEALTLGECVYLMEKGGVTRLGTPGEQIGVLWSRANVALFEAGGSDKLSSYESTNHEAVYRDSDGGRRLPGAQRGDPCGG